MMKPHLLVAALSLALACGCSPPETAPSGSSTSSSSAGGGGGSSASCAPTASSSSATSSSSAGTGGDINCFGVLVEVGSQTTDDAPGSYHLVTVASAGTLDVLIEASAPFAADDANYWTFNLEKNGSVWATGSGTQTVAGGGVGDLGAFPVTLYSSLPLVPGDDVALLVDPTFLPAALPASAVTARVCVP